MNVTIDSDYELLIVKIGMTMNISKPSNNDYKKVVFT